GVGGAEGGAEARALPASDAAVRDPPREHAHAAPSGRDDPLPRARLLPRRRERRRPRRLRRRARPRPRRTGERARAALGPTRDHVPTRYRDAARRDGAMTLAPDGVRTMFDRIAPVYDLMNRVMTAGLDVRWRRLAARAAVRPGDRVLDAACGTGDLAVAALRAGAGRVTGLDFSERMLERARRKEPRIEWLHGDMLALPFAD